MCGIAGVLRFDHEYLQFSWLEGMGQTLRHRGPDDEGFTLFNKTETYCIGGNDTPENVWNSRLPYSPRFRQDHNLQGSLGFVHRRLSILDTSAAGHQPLCDSTGRYWIVFNGEIYNYKEIKAELLLLGHLFYSHCDTEIILHAYMEWSEACVQKFNGMWSFSIYDRQENSLFCSRDRFGVKPFYYFHDKQHFAFASEQKALITLPFVKKKLNEKAVFDYLVLGRTELDAEGFFENILELFPGHNLFVKNGQIKVERYYTLPFTAGYGQYSAKQSLEYTERVRFLIQDAVRLRLRSDVAVGACLSGGIDSSALVCTANNMRGQAEPFHVFTSVFPGLAIDESHWAKKVVDETGSIWHTVETKPEDVLKEYQELIYTQDIPFFGSSTLAQSKVMGLIRQTGIKVTLDGQGADELFSGYPNHFYVASLQGIRHLDFANLRRLERAEPNALGFFAKFIGKQVVSSLPSTLGYRLLKESKYDFQFLRDQFWAKHFERYQENKQVIPSSLNALLHLEYTGVGLKYLMRTADRNSMHHSVESRVPFADDHRLAEYVFSLPASYKIRQGQTKYLLRESMKGAMPESIRQRWDKKGFATPELIWFKQFQNELRDQIDDNLEPFVKVKELKSEWDRLFATKVNGNTLGISRFLILSMWRKQFGV